MKETTRSLLAIIFTVFLGSIISGLMYPGPTAGAMTQFMNITWYDTKITTVDDEYSCHFSCKIRLLEMKKDDFEWVAKQAFETRRNSIKKYILERSSDGAHPEYTLRGVEARSPDDVYSALNEINDWSKPKNPRDENPPRRPPGK